MDRLVFDSDEGDGFGLYARAADGTVTLLFTHGDDCWFPRPSADGARVAYVSTPPGSHDPPDYATTSLWTMDADGTDRVEILDPDAQSPAWTFLATPHWHPNGDQIVVARATAGTALRPTVRAADGTVIDDVDFDAGAALSDPTWHPDPNRGGAGIARCTYCRDGNLVFRDWDGAAPVGARTLLFDGSAWDPNVGDPNDQGRVTCYDPDWRLDGLALAFLCDFNGFATVGVDSDMGVATCDAFGGSPTRITPDDFLYGTPTFSFDGLWVYTYRFNGNWELVRVPADGSAVGTPGLVEVLRDGGFYSEYPAPIPCGPVDCGWVDGFASLSECWVPFGGDPSGDVFGEVVAVGGEMTIIDPAADIGRAAIHLPDTNGTFTAVLGTQPAGNRQVAFGLRLDPIGAPSRMDWASGVTVGLSSAGGIDQVVLNVQPPALAPATWSAALPAPLTAGDVIELVLDGSHAVVSVNAVPLIDEIHSTIGLTEGPSWLAVEFVSATADFMGVDEVAYDCATFACDCGDDFERADGAVANGWTESAPWEIVSGEAGPALDGVYPSDAAIVRECALADVDVLLTYGTAGASFLLALARAEVGVTAPPRSIAAGVGGGTLYLFDVAVSGGSPTLLASIAADAPGTLRLVVVGSCAAVYLDDVLALCFDGPEVSAHDDTGAGALSTAGSDVDPPSRVAAICASAHDEAWPCDCAPVVEPPGPTAALGGPCGEPPRVVAPSGPLGPASPCAQVRAGIWRRGQRGVWLWLDSGVRQIDAYEWGRARSEVSTAKLGVPLGGTVDSACCDRLAAIEPWEYEVRLFRDDDEVWRGPIVTCDETAGRVEIAARDVAAWLDRRRIHVRHAFVDYDAARAWERLVGDAFSGAWPDGVRLSVSDACARVTRTVEPLPYLIASKPVNEVADGAVDWTALGPLLIAGGLCTNVIVSGTLYDDAFAGPLHLVKDGLAYAEHVWINGESDIVGDAGDPSPHVEVVFDDQGARDERTARIHAQQAWAVRGREGVPRIVSTGQGVALSPRAPVDINDLVPGRMFRISVRPGCTALVSLMRLVTVTVTGDAEGEQVVPAFEPVGDAGGRNEAG